MYIGHCTIWYENLDILYLLYFCIIKQYIKKYPYIYPKSFSAYSILNQKNLNYKFLFTMCRCFNCIFKNLLSNTYFMVKIKDKLYNSQSDIIKLYLSAINFEWYLSNERCLTFELSSKKQWCLHNVYTNKHWFFLYMHPCMHSI